MAWARLLHSSEIVSIAHKLDAVAALVGVVISLTAVCPCLPAANHQPRQSAADEHACCAGGASPVLAAAVDSCCVDSALTDRSAATPTTGAPLSIGSGSVALVTWSPSVVGEPQRTAAAFVPSPPSILRI